jgi:hypothetical protein
MNKMPIPLSLGRISHSRLTLAALFLTLVGVLASPAGADISYVYDDAGRLP